MKTAFVLILALVTSAAGQSPFGDFNLRDSVMSAIRGAQGVGSSARSDAASAADSVLSMLGSRDSFGSDVRSGASDMADRFRGAGGDFGSDMRSRGSEMGDRMREGGEDMRSRGSEMGGRMREGGENFGDNMRSRGSGMWGDAMGMGDELMSMFGDGPEGFGEDFVEMIGDGFGEMMGGLGEMMSGMSGMFEGGHGMKPGHHGMMGDIMKRKKKRGFTEKSCLPGQVFCLEQMGCIAVGKSAEKRAHLTKFSSALHHHKNPVQSCLPNEIFCFETGKCRRTSSPGVKKSITSTSGPTRRRRRRVKVKGTATFQADYNTVLSSTKRKDAFKKSFKQGLSKQLEVPEENIVVLSLAPGSIIVTFEVTSNDTTTDLSDEELMQQIEDKIATSLDSITVDNGEGDVLSVSSYKLESSVTELQDDEGVKTTDSKKHDITKEKWFWPVIGVACALVLVGLIVGLYCCCVKNKKDKVAPHSGHGRPQLVTPVATAGQQDPYRLGTARTNQQQPGMDRANTEMVPQEDTLYGTDGNATVLKPELV